MKQGSNHERTLQLIMTPLFEIQRRSPVQGYRQRFDLVRFSAEDHYLKTIRIMVGCCCRSCFSLVSFQRHPAMPALVGTEPALWAKNNKDSKILSKMALGVDALGLEAFFENTSHPAAFCCMFWFDLVSFSSNL